MLRKVPKDKWSLEKGQKNNHLTMIGDPFWVDVQRKRPRKDGFKLTTEARQRALFRCDCGKEAEFFCHQVKIGKNKSCGYDCPMAHNVPFDGKKKCFSCGKIKPLSEFHKHKTFKAGYSSQCKECKAVETMERLYGVTLDEYNRLLEEQEGGCAICGRTPSENGDRYKRLAVDHCHLTNKVRGLLCDCCNRAIGLLGDDAHLLRKAATYLDTAG